MSMVDPEGRGLPLAMRHVARPAAASTFTPLALAGTFGWYAARDTSTLFTDTARSTPSTSDADLIKGVTDKSGAGNHLSEATNPPTRKNAIQNGNTVLRFDGTNDTLGNAAAAAVGNGDYLFAFVVKSANSAGHRSLLKPGTSGMEWLMTAGVINDFFSGSSHVMNTDTGTVNWHVLILSRVSGTTTGYVDGTAEATTVADSANLTGTGFNISIGSAGVVWNGDMGEIVLAKARKLEVRLRACRHTSRASGARRR
jgi:hypothetical protein